MCPEEVSGGGWWDSELYTNEAVGFIAQHPPLKGFPYQKLGIPSRGRDLAKVEPSPVAGERRCSVDLCVSYALLCDGVFSFFSFLVSVRARRSNPPPPFVFPPCEEHLATLAPPALCPIARYAHVYGSFFLLSDGELPARVGVQRRSRRPPHPIPDPAGGVGGGQEQRRRRPQRLGHRRLPGGGQAGSQGGRALRSGTGWRAAAVLSRERSTSVLSIVEIRTETARLSGVRD